jgi:hypothetical protein
MASGGKRKQIKKVKKAAAKVRAGGKVKKAKKAKSAPTAKKATRATKKIAKRAAKKVSKRKAPAVKVAAPSPMLQDLAPSGEPEFVSNDSLMKR